MDDDPSIALDKTWPVILPEVPRIGDFVESAEGLVMRVTKVTWKTYGSMSPGSTRTMWAPEIELMRPHIEEEPC